MQKCKHCGQQVHTGQTHHCSETGESYSSDLLTTIIEAEIISDILDSPTDLGSSSTDFGSSSDSSSSVDFGGGDFGGGGGGSDW